MDARFKRFVKLFNHKGNKHYFRDTYMVFLSALIQHPRVRFGIYSSIMRKNILPIIMHMFEGHMGIFNERVVGLFDRDYN
jgi:hypothetical protein